MPDSPSVSLGHGLGILPLACGFGAAFVSEELGPWRENSRWG
jgi:hypothetical protein